jgi:hypothetical protein
MSVHVTVEEIVLHGVVVDDVPAFRSALRTRLAELAAQHRAPVAPATAALRRGTPVAAGPAAELAARVAGSVWTAATGGAR